MENGICVLGATGFLGSAIAEQLELSNANWIGVSIDKSSNPKIRTIDPHDSESLIELLGSYSIVINAVGSRKPADFENELSPSMRGFWGTVEHFSNVFEKANIKKLVHISSAGTVYGSATTDAGHKESDNLKPISWYGRAKAFEELHYEKLCTNIDIDYLCVRVANPFGNVNKTRHGFVDVLINCIENGEDFHCFNDCDPRRDFVFAPDMANMIINLINHEESGCFNIASGDSIPLSQIIDLVVNKLNVTANIQTDLCHPEYDVLNSVVDISKIKSSSCYVNTMPVLKYIEQKLK